MIHTSQICPLYYSKLPLRKNNPFLVLYYRFILPLVCGKAKGECNLQHHLHRSLVLHILIHLQFNTFLRLQLPGLTSSMRRLPSLSPTAVSILAPTLVSTLRSASPLFNNASPLPPYCSSVYASPSFLVPSLSFLCHFFLAWKFLDERTWNNSWIHDISSKLRNSSLS